MQVGRRYRAFCSPNLTGRTYKFNHLVRRRSLSSNQCLQYPHHLVPQSESCPSKTSSCFQPSRASPKGSDHPMYKHTTRDRWRWLATIAKPKIAPLDLRGFAAFASAIIKGILVVAPDVWIALLVESASAARALVTATSVRRPRKKQQFTLTAKLFEF